MRGKMNSLILNVLKTGNKYGLEIIKEIRNLTNGQVDIKLPSLYSNLHKLESDGYISSYWENSEIGGKRRYSALTEKGQNYVSEHPFNFDEYKKFENNTISNNPSSLAIQPDFFNKIEHNKRLENVASPTPQDNIENEIPNYSIMEYLESNNLSHHNTQTISNSEIENLENKENSVNEDYRVYDKTDAVLLSNEQIIPQNTSTSLLYKPTTLTNKDILDDSINYQDIFGEMIEKDDATLFEEQNEKVDLTEYDFSEKGKGILLDPNVKSKYSDEYLSMVSNVYDKKNAPKNNDENSFIDKYLQNNTVEETNKNKEEKINILENPKSNIDSYFMKEKVKVDDNLKANIFLKKQGVQSKPNINYDFSYVDNNKLSKNPEPIISSSKLFNYNNKQENEQPNEPLKTMAEFVADCEENGITVQRYRTNTKKLKSHKVYIYKTHLLTSIMTFATLIALLFVGYFIFESTTTDLKPIIYTFVGVACCGLIYPIVVAIISSIKGYKLIGYYNMRKEWLPRIIVFCVIVLITFAINFFCGMNLNNIDEYLPFICLPLIGAFVVYIDYLYKLMLVNIKAFRED